VSENKWGDLPAPRLVRLSGAPAGLSDGTPGQLSEAKAALGQGPSLFINGTLLLNLTLQSYFYAFELTNSSEA
jgi:hypothetical protein